MVLNATFKNILVISWRSVLLVDATEIHRPASRKLQTLSPIFVYGDIYFLFYIYLHNYLFGIFKLFLLELYVLIYFILLCFIHLSCPTKPHRWCNGQFVPRSGQTKEYKIGICFFSVKHAALRRKGKSWLARNKDNVSDGATCLSIVSL